MEAEKKYFDGLNADDDPHLLGDKDFINAENIRIGTTDDGTAGFVENIKGNEALPYTEREANVVIGMCKDEEKDRIISFYFSYAADDPTEAFHHVIELYDKRTGLTHRLLKADNVSGGLFNTNPNGVIPNDFHTGGLNFDRNTLIHSAVVVGDLLYWTDGLNEPKVLNIERAIRTYNGAYVSPDGTIPEPYVVPLKQEDITVLRRPPIYPLAVNKKTDPFFTNNYIRHEAFQFSSRYTYKDNEISVAGAWSKLIEVNRDNQQGNYVEVKFATGERIPNTVQKVELLVRLLNSDLVFVAKTWDKSVTTERIQLTAHNDATANLQFDYYNNQAGLTLSKSDADKLQDHVPRTAGTLEVAKNRLFFGDLKVDYNLPKIVRLAVAVGQRSVADEVVGTRYRVDAVFFDDQVWNYITYAAYWIHVTSGITAGYYLINVTRNTSTVGSINPHSPPSPITLNDLTYLAATQNDSIVVERNLYNRDSHNQFYVTDPNSVLILLSSGLDARSFKYNSYYRAGIAFYDELGRKMGMYTDDTMSADVPQRDYAGTTVKSAINWTLTNDIDTVNEIPLEAFYYSIVLSKNLRTRFFMQSFDDAPKYIKRNDDGTYATPQSNTTDASNVALNLQTLNKYGMGYGYTEGDLCTVFHSDGRTPVTLPVVGVTGKYVLLQFHDFGTFSGSTKILFELYTPYKYTDYEPYFEVGNRYPIVAAGKANRTFGTLTGSLNGDVNNIARASIGAASFQAEVMNINDKFWRRWFTDHSSPLPRLNYKEKRLPYTMVFSNVYVQGTENNGMSSFDALNQEDLPEEMGRLRKLFVTSKVQFQGSVMLAIGENETASIYLGETQLTDNTGNSFLASSKGVVGTVNILQGSYGTRNPESVARFRGMVFWYDVYNGVVIQYSVNGLMPVSNYKMRRVMRQFSIRYASLSVAQLEAIDLPYDGEPVNRPFVFGGIDPYHGEYLLALPSVLTAHPKGNLSDYSDPDIAYPYDIYDGRAKVLLYKIETDKWQGSHTYRPHWLIDLGMDLYSNYRILYRHNASSVYNRFYGVAYPSRLMFVANGGSPNSLKVFQSLSVESEVKPNFTHLRTEIPYVQSTDLVQGDYDQREGVNYAGILRDRLSPNVSGSVDKKQITGDKMRGSYMMLMLQFAATTLNRIRFVNIIFNKSTGHLN